MIQSPGANGSGWYTKACRPFQREGRLPLATAASCRLGAPTALVGPADIPLAGPADKPTLPLPDLVELSRTRSWCRWAEDGPVLLGEAVPEAALRTLVATAARLDAAERMPGDASFRALARGGPRTKIQGKAKSIDARDVDPQLPCSVRSSSSTGVVLTAEDPRVRDNRLRLLAQAAGALRQGRLPRAHGSQALGGSQAARRGDEAFPGGEPPGER